MKANVLAITSEPPILRLILRSFVTGLILVSATVTEETTNVILEKLIDKVKAAVLYINEEMFVATISVMGFILLNAHFLPVTTLSHCRMTIPQPGRVPCTTFVNPWTYSHHFPPCISLETMPAIKRVVTFLNTCSATMFSVCVCQIYVLGTFN